MITLVEYDLLKLHAFFFLFKMGLENLKQNNTVHFFLLDGLVWIVG